jgi:hypothetical protein
MLLAIHVPSQQLRRERTGARKSGGKKKLAKKWNIGSKKKPD